MAKHYRQRNIVYTLVYGKFLVHSEGASTFVAILTSFLPLRRDRMASSITEVVANIQVQCGRLCTCLIVTCLS